MLGVHNHEFILHSIGQNISPQECGGYSLKASRACLHQVGLMGKANKRIFHMR